MHPELEVSGEVAAACQSLPPRRQRETAHHQYPCVGRRRREGGGGGRHSVRNCKYSMRLRGWGGMGGGAAEGLLPWDWKRGRRVDDDVCVEGDEIVDAGHGVLEGRNTPVTKTVLTAVLPQRGASAVPPPLLLHPCFRTFAFRDCGSVTIVPRESETWGARDECQAKKGGSTGSERRMHRSGTLTAAVSSTPPSTSAINSSKARKLFDFFGTGSALAEVESLI